mgnify:CR=1 FL=1
MSEEYTTAKEIGQNVGKVCSKFLNITGSYLNYAYNNLSAGYQEFVKETKPAVTKFSKSNNLDECIDEELKNVPKKEGEEINEQEI